MAFGENQAGWLGLPRLAFSPGSVSLLEPPEWPEGSLGALAVFEAFLPTHLDFNDGFVRGIVVDDVHIAGLESVGSVGTQGSGCHEEHKIGQVFSVLFEADLLWMLGAFARGFVQLPVLIRGKPCTVRDFSGGAADFLTICGSLSLGSCQWKFLQCDQLCY